MFNGYLYDQFEKDRNKLSTDVVQCGPSPHYWHPMQPIVPYHIMELYGLHWMPVRIVHGIVSVIFQ